MPGHPRWPVIRSSGRGSAFLDTNSDGTLCLKAVSPDLRGQSGKQWAYSYLSVDNKHPRR